jgi:hypothetical protein
MCDGRAFRPLAWASDLLVGTFLLMTWDARLIHRSLAFDDNAIHRANFVQKNDQRIPYGNFARGNVLNSFARLAMRGAQLRVLSQRL